MCVVDVLAEVFRLHKGEQDIEEAKEYWRGVVEGGRVKVRRSKKSRDDTSPLAVDFCVVQTDFVVEKQDRLKILKHTHERVVTGEDPNLLFDNDKFFVVNKPPGIPCVDAEGGHNNIVSLATQMLNAQGRRVRLHLVHRLDKPVGGILILSRGGGLLTTAMKALADRKATKTYVARVKGRFPEGKDITCDEALSYDSKLNKATAGTGDRFKPALTKFNLLDYNEALDESVVTAYPVTGLRHQIRVHLSIMGYPITNDVLYGGTAPPPVPLYQDDEHQTLRAILNQTRKEWCPKCTWVENTLSKESLLPPPTAEPPIYLHAIYYEIPSVDLKVSCPPPSWATF
eukprot:TRINITY_DN21150_c0_g1_i1.p1 TRINITY_DN21150_c0_g1~~TRINITY_DN21150_c0_g1_i1.p1  ORF type:complete len:385 (+),score=120.21 TRINITY_DN21150_c0_g1_i1:132-1157(+)